MGGSPHGTPVFLYNTYPPTPLPHHTHPHTVEPWLSILSILSTTVIVLSIAVVAAVDMTAMTAVIALSMVLSTAVVAVVVLLCDRHACMLSIAVDLSMLSTVDAVDHCRPLSLLSLLSIVDAVDYCRLPSVEQLSGGARC